MSQAPANAKGPFIGLTYFTKDDAKFFFGRESERNVLIANLRAARLTLLYAQSGVGKSSLLQASVAVRLSELAERVTTQQRAALYIPVFLNSWSGDPTAALIAAISEAIKPFGKSAADDEVPGGDLEKTIELATKATSATLLIILDQFEEYFLYHPRQATEGTFADQLARCVNRPDLRANFLISVREDAYSGIGDVLKSRVSNVYGNYVHLEYLDEDAARAAITKPVDRFNELRGGTEPAWRVDDDLVDAVVASVQHQGLNGAAGEEVQAGVHAGGAEPAYLQLIMLRLWDEEQAAGSHTLRLETLERLGGAAMIISRHVTAAIEQLPDAEQDAAARLFRYLVGSRGKEAAASAADLADRSDIPESELQPILRTLAAGEVKILRPVAAPELGGPLRYEIFHDSLAEPIRKWRADHEQEAKEAAQTAAKEAQAREAHQRTRRRRAQVAAGILVGLFAVALLAATLFYIDLSRDERAKATSIESSGRIIEYAASPTFGAAAAGITGLAAERHMHATFASRSTILAQLQTNVGLPKVAVGHTRQVNAVAFFPNSAVLVSGSSDGSIRFWDAQGTRIGDPLPVGIAGTVVLAVAVSPNGKLLAAGGTSGTIGLWDVSNPRIPKALRLPVPAHHAQEKDNASERGAAFSPDGKLLAVGDGKGRVLLWNVQDPESVRPYGYLKLPGDALGSLPVDAPGDINDLAFDPNPARSVLAVASDNGVFEYDELTAQPHELRHPSKSAALALAFAPDGSLAWTVYDTSQPGIFIQTAVGDASPRFLPTTDIARSLAFTEGGRTLVSGGDDWNVTTWDVKTGSRFGPPRTEGAYDPIYGVTVSPDGRTIASAGNDAVLKLWPVRPTDPLATTIGTRTSSTIAYIYSLAVGRLRGRTQVAAAEGADGVMIWSLDQATRDTRAAAVPLSTLPAKTAAYSVAWHADKLAVGDDKNVSLYDTGAACRTPCLRGASPELATDGHPIHSGLIWSLAFDGSGNILASGGADGRVILWDVSNPRKPHSIWGVREHGDIFKVVFSPKAHLLAAAGDDGRIWLWDVTTPGHPKQLGSPMRGHDGFPVTSMAFSPHDGTLVSGGEDQQIRFWIVGKGGLRPSGATLFQTDTILSLAFAPDGETLAAGDSQSTCLYDVKTRRTIGSGSCLLGGGTDTNSTRLGTISALTFARDGEMLISAGQGNPVVAWNSLLWDRSTTSATFERLTSAVCAITPADTPTTSQWNAVFTGTPLEDRPQDMCERARGGRAS